MERRGQGQRQDRQAGEPYPSQGGHRQGGGSSSGAAYPAPQPRAGHAWGSDGPGIAGAPPATRPQPTVPGQGGPAQAQAQPPRVPRSAGAPTQQVPAQQYPGQQGQPAFGRQQPGQPPSAGLGLADGDGARQEAYQRATTEQGVAEGDVDLPTILTRMLELNASDVHLSAGSPPLVRLHGDLAPIDGIDAMTSPMLQRVLYSVLTQKQRERFEEDLELDFAYSLPGKARFRVNLYRQRESIGAAFRVIPYEIKSLASLGIPPSVANFASLPRGMVLVTGPTGSGKSTTLAALIDLANSTRREHIMTVEDPIEFLHRHKSCLVNQREVGEDTRSFSNALKHALRQDPDIILVGEMRDLETISVALTAAETGHLVFATLHTQDAAQTIDRVIDVFPPHQQQQIRVQLAGTIQGIACQTLCKRADGTGRVVATEVLVATPAIRNLIREGKTHQIYSSMQAGAQFGMHTLDQHLAELVRARHVAYEHGLEKCHHVEDFNRLCGLG